MKKKTQKQLTNILKSKEKSKQRHIKSKRNELLKYEKKKKRLSLIVVITIYII